MPYSQAGLTERQAAAHLLNRFAYGPRPGEVDQVVKIGLENWLEQQLQADLPDASLKKRLEPYPALKLSAREIVEMYPNPGQVRREALRDGVITANDVQTLDKAGLQAKLLAYAREKGYRPQQELISEAMAQKLLRAVYSENELAATLTDFWFNHFNVSVTTPQTRPYLLSYERDAIRPNVFGRFQDLLGATAMHPAMLLYLNNAESTANPGAPILAGFNGNGRVRRANRRNAPLGTALSPIESTANTEPMTDGTAVTASPLNVTPVPKAKRGQQRGINENYARELMELHTLGVDGGYTQKDVQEVARAFTGWGIVPAAIQGGGQIPAQPERRGFVLKDQFLFRPGTHDAGEKTILGQAFPAGGGMAEGERVLDMLSRSPATAHHLSLELAQHFVSDTPPKALVDRLSRTFLHTDGDLKAMIRALADSPEFWSKTARSAKIKTPFELVAGSLRALDADVVNPRPTLQWVDRMGERPYSCIPPTGYPDRADAWVSAGALLNRMNFGLQLATSNVPGVRVNLAGLNGDHEPESPEAALKTYAALLLPERDLADTMKQLEPVIRDPEFVHKVDAVAPPMKAEQEEGNPEMASAETMENTTNRPLLAAAGRGKRTVSRPPRRQKPPTMLGQVVGVLLGSPEFQRR